MLAWTVITALATAAMAFTSWRLVIVNNDLLALQRETKEAARAFQDWSKERIAAREEPELVVQGIPRVSIGDHSAASRQAMGRITVLISNPGELLTTLLSVKVQHKTVTALEALDWSWTSLFPMLSLPVAGLTGDSDAAKKLLITDSLPAPAFAGGLLKLESTPVALTFDDAEKLRQDSAIILALRYRPGNLPERSIGVTAKAVVAWPNH